MCRLLSTGTVRPLGRMRGASNETLLATVTGSDASDASDPSAETQRTVRAVLKTRAGERPLHDFPTGTLSLREVAAHRLSAHLGLDVVPPTVWRDDIGAGASLQAYVESDPTADEPVVLVAEDAVDDGLAPVLRAVLSDGTDVVLAHSLTQDMRRLALFDVLINNADRKGGHVLRGAWEFADGARPRVALHAIDNGLSFHAEPKLRTVLWGFAGSPLTAEERALLECVRGEDLDPVLGDVLATAEIEALSERATRLLSTGILPLPDADRSAVPWPPL